MLNALKQKGVQNMRDVWVNDVHQDRLEYIRQQYGVNTSGDMSLCCENADVIILAVKPQNVPTVASELKGQINGLLLSIVAGCTIEQLKESFSTDRIVRSMPNTPAMILEAITVWTATKDTPPDLVTKAKTLLGSIGEEIEVADEG